MLPYYVIFLVYFLLHVTDVTVQALIFQNQGRRLKRVTLNSVIKMDHVLDKTLKAHISELGNRNEYSLPKVSLTLNEMTSQSTRPIPGIPEGKREIYAQGKNRFIIYDLKTNADGKLVRSSKHIFLLIKGEDGQPVIVPYKKKEYLNQLNPLLNSNSIKKIVDGVMPEELKSQIKDYSFKVQPSIVSYSDKDGNFRNAYMGIKVPLDIKLNAGVHDKWVKNAFTDSDPQKMPVVKLKANIKASDASAIMEVSKVQIPKIQVEYKPYIIEDGVRKNMAFYVDQNVLKSDSQTFHSKTIKSDIDDGRAMNVLYPAHEHEKAAIEKGIERWSGQHVREIPKPKYQMYHEEQKASPENGYSEAALAIAAVSTGAAGAAIVSSEIENRDLKK